MFNKYDPKVNTIISFLKLFDVKVNNSTVDETLQNHPDWPGLLCISDSLNKWNLPNAAGKIEQQLIERLPTPFLAYTNNFSTPLEIISDVSETSVTVLSNRKQKIKSENKEDFFKRWTGIYLMAEKNEIAGEQNFEINRRNSFVNNSIPALFITLLILVTTFFIHRNLTVFSNFITVIGVYFQFIILLAGILVSSLLLWHEIDSNNPVLHKVCTGIIKGNCDAILSGKQSKVFSWLSWSEVGFFYFTGGLLTLLLAAPLNSAISIIAYFNLLALPYTVFSIYYQGRVAKQWCILCLTVQVLLVAGGINVLVNRLLLPISQISVMLIITSLILYIIPVLAWYSIKPYLLRLQEAKNTRREYLRLKFNSEIFDTLLKKQKQLTASIEGIGIDLGNPSATNILVKVCSPYCGPCAAAHPKIEALMDEIPNLKVKIIFTAPNDPTHKLFKPVSHFLTLATENKGAKHIKQGLDDWYLAEKKDYKYFALNHPVTEELARQGPAIEAMFKWCTEMNIQYTPTFFINGFELPRAYSIEDLQYFLLE